MKSATVAALVFAALPAVLGSGNAVHAQARPQPRLLRDINTQPTENPDSDPQQIVRLGSFLFLSARFGPEKNGGGNPAPANNSGRELYKSLGLPNSTTLVKDIWPGPGDSEPRRLFVHGSTLYFAANDGTHGTELWRSDGTSAGTVLVKDIYAGSATDHGNPREFVALDSTTVLFTAENGTHGTELWKTDGTTQGTVMVRDIYPGSNGGRPNHASPILLTKVGKDIFFRARSSMGTELWKSDGSKAGTVQVADLWPGSGSSLPGHLVAFQGRLFFSARNATDGTELWSSDGTAQGTAMIKDIHAGKNSSSPALLTAVGSTLFFQARDAGGAELWKTDGSKAGTVQVKDILAGSTGSNPQHLVAMGSHLYFQANNGSHGAELWRSDGTAQGTAMVKDIRGGLGSSSPMHLVVHQSELFFVANDGSRGSELWRTDGSAQGTYLVKDINPNGSEGSFPMSLTTGRVVKLFFGADDGQHGRELWSSNGKAADTRMIQDVNPQVKGSTRSATPESITTAAGITYFAADDGQNGSELWKTDGTGAGTAMVKDIFPGKSGNRPQSSRPSHFFLYGDIVLFSATDNSGGRELWKTDGTAQGTVMVKDILAGSGGSDPSGYFGYRDMVLFRAHDNTHGTELWRTDGTARGTTRVADIQPGSLSSSPMQLTEMGGKVFFVAASKLGNELWQTDGTASGTVLVKDIHAGAQGSGPQSLTALGNKLFFRARDSSHGYEMWETDGSLQGTRMVQDLNPGPAHGVPSEIVRVGDTLYFQADDGKLGAELWRSQGTAASTAIVKDIHAGTNSSYPGSFTLLGNRLVFAARDGQNGNTTSGTELWITDGSTAGTTLLKDIRPGSAESYPKELLQVGSRHVYFVADDGQHGNEVWRTDGTTAGTQLVFDLHPGQISSDPTQLTRNKGQLLFRASDDRTGYEIWQLRLPASSQQIGPACAQVGRGPELFADDPVLGRTVTLQLQGGAKNSRGVLLIGLPADRPQGLGGACALFVDARLPTILVPLAANGGGVWRLPIPVPNNAAIQGATVAAQAGIGPTGTAPFGLDLSNGLFLTAGN